MKRYIVSTSKILASLLLGVLVSASIVLAQGNFGSITGGVYDATGAVIPGVEVTAVGLETGLRLSAETTTVGTYLIPNLPNGEYSVTVTSTGFKTFTHPAVTVSTGTVTTVDATLEIGDVTETVTVEAASVQLETTTSGVGSVMNEDVFRKVPYDLHGMNVQSGVRQPQQFIVLVPGVTGDSSNHTINPGLPFWPSWHGQGRRSAAAMQRFSHFCHVRYPFPCCSGRRMLPDCAVPATAEGFLATSLPRRSSATRVRQLVRAVGASLPAQVAPQSAPASGRTACGSDGPQPATASSSGHA